MYNNFFSKHLKMSETPTEGPSQGSSTTDSYESRVRKIESELVRVEYPGLVKDVDRALETLGGIASLEMVVVGKKQNPELNFHPDNLYSKPCSGENDNKPGILIRVTPGGGEEYDYEVLGATTMNLKFNKLCDFQYQPIIEKEDDTVEVVYENIIPQKLPNLNWFLSSNITNQPKLSCPNAFSRFDSAHNKLYLNAYEKFNSATSILRSKPIRVERARTRRPRFHKAHGVNLSDQNADIPSEPMGGLMQILHAKRLIMDHKRVKALFEERPIWSRAAVQYLLDMNFDKAKVLLPSVAYFCRNGPWRMCWIKLGYNPLKDFNSRIYQILDYRIRTSEGTQLKVTAKRKYTKEVLISQKSYDEPKLSTERSKVEEQAFLLKPGYIPPARQMFYQYCDIHLPAIQDMLQRLPKIPTHMKFDPKNGWLPSNFTEQCREIVNRYILEQVQREFLREKKLQEEEHQRRQDEEDTESASYCSKMLSSIQDKMYRSVNVAPLREEPEAGGSSMASSLVDLIEDEENMDMDIDPNPEYPDSDETEEESSINIDMELLNEINELVAIREKSKKD